MFCAPSHFLVTSCHWMTVIPACCPAITTNNEEVEQVNYDLFKLIKMNKTKWTIIMGWGYIQTSLSLTAVKHELYHGSRKQQINLLFNWSFATDMQTQLWQPMLNDEVLPVLHWYMLNTLNNKLYTIRTYLW